MLFFLRGVLQLPMATLTTTLTLDLHVHTNYSHDGTDSVEKTIKSAKAKKLDGIAICDHDTMDGSYAAREYIADNGTVEFSSEIAISQKFTAEHTETAKAQENRK